jgi:hypothetical protein
MWFCANTDGAPPLKAAVRLIATESRNEVSDIIKLIAKTLDRVKAGVWVFLGEE